MKDAFVFIKHMRDAINLIQKFTKGYTKEKFFHDEQIHEVLQQEEK